MNIEMIPLNKLIPSPANARKIGTGIAIEELAASIAAHGLLQNLQVRPARAKSGKFEVTVGGRRLAALRLLVKEKKLAKDVDIPCNLRDDDDAGETSLAENVMREPMHPADQFDGFKAMADAGKGPEDIAVRFGTTPATVRQRLKLAAVSPRLLDLYRADAMNLDQLMAFAVSDDHAAQEAAWFDQPDFNHTPAAIRRILTAAYVEAQHKRARFVGIDAYMAAGGILSRDLFQPEHEGYLTDPALLDRPVTAKLESEAEAVRAEGWAWVEIMPDLDYGMLRRIGRATPERQPIPEAQTEELDNLSAEYEALIEEHGEEPEPEIAPQLESLSERIDSLSEGLFTWRAEDMARSGAIVAIGHDGDAEIERGLIRSEDKQAPVVIRPAESEDDTDGTDASPALPDRLIEDLTAHRTAALRIMLTDNPPVALAAVVHAMALPVFYGDSYGTASCLGLRAHGPDLRSSAEGIADSRAAQTLDERHAAWTRHLPQEAHGLWDWLLTQAEGTLTALLACCAAFTVNAVHKPQDRADAPHLLHADRLATALGLDMTQWWPPTAASYVGRVSKARILEAVTEACSKGAAENLAKLKKDALAKRAEEKLAGTGWLPPVLRPTVPVSGDTAGAEAEISEAA